VYGSDFREKRRSDAMHKQWFVDANPTRLLSVFVLAVLALIPRAQGQTSCADGNSALDTAQPENMSSAELIQKFLAGEDRVQSARTHYSYTQNVLVQTLDGNAATDGQFHEVTTVSYDDKGRRLENVSFAEQSTLRGIQLSSDDMEDIRVFMPWVLTSELAPQYTITYMGRQHVDDLDTYVFHVVPKKEEKNKRYFEGRVWVDNRDVQVVKLCGKSVPEAPKPKKKNQPIEANPTFVTYRQIVDGNWFPAYSRIDDTLTFGTQSIHVREIVKFTGYKRTDTTTTTTASKP